MANNLSPDILAQILAMYGGTPNNSQQGISQWYGSGDMGDYSLNKFAGGDWQGGDAGSWVADPSRDQTLIRQKTDGGMVNVFDDKGQFVEQDTQSDDSTKNLLTLAAMAAGGSALGGAFGDLGGLGSMFSGGGGSAMGGLDLAALDGAAGISGGNAGLWGGAAGGTGGGMFGGLETLGDMSAPGYFTSGTELPGSFLNASGAAAEPVAGGFTGSFDAALSAMPDAATSFSLGSSPLSSAALDATLMGGIGTGLPAYGTTALGALGAVSAAAGGGGGLLSSLSDFTGIRSLADLSKLAPLAALIKGPDDPPTNTTTRTLDPRIDAAVFGPGGSFEAMKSWFDANKATGQNDTMRNAQTQLRNTLTSPELLAIQKQQADAAKGLLGTQVASNPFANWKFPGLGG